MGFFLDYIDISDQTDRERELARPTERLAEFPSVVCHDTRNPVTVATGRLDPRPRGV